MAEKLLKEHLYGDLLAPTPGYSTDFALGMTYCLSFEAMLTAHLAFGMLGEMDDNVIQSPHLLLEAITKSSEKVVVFCNKGGIAVPPTIRKVYSLMERNIFEVFDKQNNKANFHPKLWLIREINNDDKNDVLLKLIVTSRNLAYTDTIDCIACLTGKVGGDSVKNEKHYPLGAFIKSVVEESNIGEEQKKSVLKLAIDLERVEKFDVDDPFEDYDFFPYLFNSDFGIPKVEDYLVGTESIVVSPFLDKTMLSRLNPDNKCNRTLITRKEYVDRSIFDRFRNKGGIYVTLDDLASRGMDLHAKMYHVWNGRNGQYLYLGSANATTSAFEHNGEFLLGLKYKYGNTRSAQFLSDFYEKDNSDSRFMPLNEPLENASPVIKWDVSESAMKDLMCANDLKARITHHRDGGYSVVVTSSMKRFVNDVFIAPLQKKELLQRWTGRATFEDMKIDELSEFDILSATSPDEIHHEAIVKIETTGMPSDRDQEIYKGIIKTKNESFSKFLVFSSWGMVPKMLACLISYETERRLFRRTNEIYHKEDSQLLKDSAKTKALTIMHTVSTCLADMYDPEECFGMSLSAIKQQIKKTVKNKLNKFESNTVSRVSSLDIYQLLVAFDNPDEEIRNIPEEADDVLAEMAIGAPAMCLYRIFKRIGDANAKEHAEDVAKDLIAIFNNRQGIAAVRNNCRTHSNYFQNVVDYCIMGNLQAVLDEFVHMIGENKSPETVVARMKESFASAYPQQVNTIQTFGTDEKYTMRKHFAVDFGSGKQTEKDVTHATNVRSAFNSPFRPFVLASTSVGQEGLDFHWYCRKMIHWNLPSNPQNMEQREGRINRYKCLSVRRNIAKLYSESFKWDDMFDKASTELKGENPEMVPFWYLPLNDEHFKGIETEKIERIVPMFPMSEDESRYSRLIKVLSLYRLTMGQPRQEELLQMLEGKISQDQIKQLLFDLSPFSRNKNKNS